MKLPPSTISLPVGHNLAFDLSYSLYGFADGWLPPAWRDYRRLVRTWLPGARREGGRFRGAEPR